MFLFSLKLRVFVKSIKNACDTHKYDLLFIVDACRHHPGVPFFHDAYKGWTCCNKKSVDFTEFLNIKGCEVSKHSNVKPPEPEKPTPKEVVEDIPVAEIREPLKPSALVRPAVETPLINLVPTIAPALKQSIDSLIPAEVKKTTNVNRYILHTRCYFVISKINIHALCIFSEIAIGTVCKNGGCGIAYESPSTNDTSCIHHPGTPIFHEGLKYWSCCAKKTTDFTAFMSQRGCKTGDHKWISNVCITMFVFINRFTNCCFFVSLIVV